MKHLTYAEKNLLTGDEAADTLVRYAAALGNMGSDDTVSLECIGADGDAVTATFVIGQGAPLMIETSSGHLPEPDNSAAISYMEVQIERLLPRPAADHTDSSWDREVAEIEMDY